MLVALSHPHIQSRLRALLGAGPLTLTQLSLCSSMRPARLAPVPQHLLSLLSLKLEVFQARQRAPVGPTFDFIHRFDRLDRARRRRSPAAVAAVRARLQQLVGVTTHAPLTALPAQGPADVRLLVRWLETHGVSASYGTPCAFAACTQPGCCSSSSSIEPRTPQTQLSPDRVQVARGELPEDVWGHVAGFLHAPELAVARLVCSDALRAVQAHPMWPQVHHQIACDAMSEHLRKRAGAPWNELVMPAYEQSVAELLLAVRGYACDFARAQCVRKEERGFNVACSEAHAAYMRAAHSLLKERESWSHLSSEQRRASRKRGSALETRMQVLDGRLLHAFGFDIVVHGDAAFVAQLPRRGFFHCTKLQKQIRRQISTLQSMANEPSTGVECRKRFACTGELLRRARSEVARHLGAIVANQTLPLIKLHKELDTLGLFAHDALNGALRLALHPDTAPFEHALCEAAERSSGVQMAVQGVLEKVRCAIADATRRVCGVLQASMTHMESDVGAWVRFATVRGGCVGLRMRLAVRALACERRGHHQHQQRPEGIHLHLYRCSSHFASRLARLLQLNMLCVSPCVYAADTDTCSNSKHLHECGWAPTGPVAVRVAWTAERPHTALVYAAAENTEAGAAAARMFCECADDLRGALQLHTELLGRCAPCARRLTGGRTMSRGCREQLEESERI